MYCQLLSIKVTFMCYTSVQRPCPGADASAAAASGIRAGPLPCALESTAPSVIDKRELDLLERCLKPARIDSDG